MYSTPTVATGAGRTAGRGTADARARGFGAALRVRVFAGADPVTRRDRYFSETVEASAALRAVRRRRWWPASKPGWMGQRSVQSSVTLGYALDEWLNTVEVEDITRDGFVVYIERTMRPAPISKLSTRTLEAF